jgi:hypothetical protein
VVARLSKRVRISAGVDIDAARICLLRTHVIGSPDESARPVEK